MEAPDERVQDKIIAALKEAGEPIGPKEISERTGANYSSVQQELLRMVPKRVKKVGRGRYEIANVSNNKTIFDSQDARDDSAPEMLPKRRGGERSWTYLEFVWNGTVVARFPIGPPEPGDGPIRLDVEPRLR